MLVLSRADVEALLDLDLLVDALARAMEDLSAGRASMPPRVAAVVPEREGLLAAMPAYLPSAAALTTKLVSVFPNNVDRPTHQGLLCCFDPATGTPSAVMDATYITAVRTAAVSALATRLLANPPGDDGVLAVIGTGEQARAHVRAVPRVWPAARVLVAGRDPHRVQALAEEVNAEVASIEAAVRAARVVCLGTHAAEPVVRRSWISPGTHVNSVGYNVAGTGEVDADTVRDALVVVESRASALAPPPAGAVELQGAEAVVELGELVGRTAEGRTHADEITLYKSVGVAVQDAAAAALVLAEAHATGVGTEVSL